MFSKLFITYLLCNRLRGVFTTVALEVVTSCQRGYFPEKVLQSQKHQNNLPLDHFYYCTVVLWVISFAGLVMFTSLPEDQVVSQFLSKPTCRSYC